MDESDEHRFTATIPVEFIGVEEATRRVSGEEIEARAKAHHDRWTGLLFTHWMLVVALFFFVFPAAYIGGVLLTTWEIAMIVAAVTVSINQGAYWALSDRIASILGRRSRKPVLHRVRQRSRYEGEIVVRADGTLRVEVPDGAAVRSTREILGAVPAILADSLERLEPDVDPPPPPPLSIDLDAAALHLVRTPDAICAIEINAGAHRAMLSLGDLAPDDLAAIPLIDRPAIEVAEIDALVTHLVRIRDELGAEVPVAVRRLASARVTVDA